MRNKLLKLFDITFWKFIIVGIINTLFGISIMFVFYNVFHFSYWLSSASNYFFGSILSYLLNRYFTFNNRVKSYKTIFRFILNISVCYLVAYGIAKPISEVLLSSFSQNIQVNMAMLIGMCLFVGLNYIGQRYFVFRSAIENNNSNKI